MITLERLRNAVLQATGFDALPAGFTLVDVVNEAHQQWVTEATWSYLDGKVQTLALVSGQDEYPLGAFVGEVTDAWMGNVSTGRVKIIDPSLFERYKGLGFPTPEAWPYGCVRWAPDPDNENEPRATLVLYPAPTGTDTLTVVYRSVGVRIQTTGAVMDIPLPLEPIFLEYFRAYCRGLMLPERPLVLELAAVRLSTMFRAAVTSQMPHRVLTPTMGNVGIHMADEDWTGDDYYARRW